MMRVPFLLPKTHPVVARELAGWQKRIWLFRGINLFALVMMAFFLLAIVVLTWGIFAIYASPLSTTEVIFINNLSLNLRAVIVGVVHLIFRLLAATIIVVEFENLTWEALKLTGISINEILRGKFFAIFYRLGFLIGLVIAFNILIALMTDALIVSTASTSFDVSIGFPYWWGFFVRTLTIVFFSFLNIFYNLVAGLFVSTLARTRTQAVMMTIIWFAIEAIMVFSLSTIYQNIFLPFAISEFSGRTELFRTIFGVLSWTATILTMLFEIALIIAFFRLAERRLTREAKPIF